MVQVNWLVAAKDDLKEIYNHIAKDSKNYAKHQVLKIKDSTNILKSLPKLGKNINEIEDNSIREIIEGNYRIIYRIKSENTIDILLIHHSARDLKRRI